MRKHHTASVKPKAKISSRYYGGMYVVDVVPFAKAAPGGSLSYRSPTKLERGDIVMVQLRKRKVPGVVVGIEEAFAAKATLKSASFTISGAISKPIGCLPDNVMEAVLRTSVWHAAALGSVLHQLLEPWVEETDVPTLVATNGSGFLVRPVECPLPERKTRYRELIAESEARERATLLVVSTLAEIEYWKKAFADLSPVVLSGTLKEEKRAKALQEARNAKSLVLATPHFAFAQIERLDTVIIERVGAGGFRLPKRPFLDIRIALLELARSRALRIVYGDFPLPLEYRAGLRKLGGKPEPVTLIDARAEREEGEAWSAIPSSLRERIAAELLEGGRVAVFAARKGYSPVVICRDCGQALKDERGKVFAFTTEGGKRLFRTADGKSELSTSINCPNCGSWNLLPLGVGVERVAEELQANFPEAPFVQFDADTVRTMTGAKRRLATLNELGSLVVGTEALAPWLLASGIPISLSVIASADSLLALPFWRARERFLRLGYLLTALAPRAVIATRLPEDAAVRTLANPSDPSFFEEEGQLRSALGYPPFGTLISFTWQGSLRVLDSVEKEVRGAVEGHSFLAVPDRYLRGTILQRTFVLTLPRDVWPDTKLSVRLSSLPPTVRVMVDPESFW
jgi:primosomal protein N'